MHCCSMLHIPVCVTYYSSAYRYVSHMYVHMFVYVHILLQQYILCTAVVVNNTNMCMYVIVFVRMYVHAYKDMLPSKRKPTVKSGEK